MALLGGVDARAQHDCFSGEAAQAGAASIAPTATEGVRGVGFGLDDHGSSSPGSSSHCDYCGHASGVAVGTSSPLIATALIASMPVKLHRDSLRCDPPLDRLDRPPR